MTDASDLVGAQPCICGSGQTYYACCLAAWSETYMDEVLREGKFAGPQRFLEAVEVETPRGWQPMGGAVGEPRPLGAHTPIRMKLSEFGEEVVRRIGEAGLYTEQRVHPSRRKAPPRPPRKRQEDRRRKRR